MNGAFSGAGSVTVNGGTATFAGAYTATGPVTLSSGNLIFNTPNGVSLPTFTQSNGTLGGAATVTVNGALSWSGGTMSGSGRTVANGPLTLDGQVKYLDRRTLDIASGATWSGANPIGTSTGAVINVLPGVTFDIQNDQALVYNGGQRPTFNNAGTVTKSAGAGTSRIDMIFNNTGTLNLRAGTFQINGGGGNNSSVMDIAGGRTLDINGPYTNAATGVIQGTGTLDIRDAQFTNNGTIAPTVIILQ
ncbi:MAG: hypothetical protein IPM84_04720 [Anaerolineae bacterium]|nr:hypothetical protein [Anaerolineae bacterium]